MSKADQKLAKDQVFVKLMKQFVSLNRAEQGFPGREKHLLEIKQKLVDRKAAVLAQN